MAMKKKPIKKVDVKKKPAPEKQELVKAPTMPIVDVNLILDRSGSLQPYREKTVAGVNEYVSQLRTDNKTAYLFTLSLFYSNDRNEAQIDQPYVQKPLHEIDPLHLDQYQPAGGTPLLDAIGHTIKKAETIGADKHLVVIMTDGEENSSHDWPVNAGGYQKIKQMIADKESLGNWTFVFLGATLEAARQAQSMGVSAGNTALYASANVGPVMASMGEATRTYSSSAAHMSRSFVQDFKVGNVNELEEEDPKKKI
jgi:hypothetical protein